MSWLVGLAVAAFAVYALVVAFFYVSQRAMLFPAPSGYASPEAVGLEGVREVPLRTADGETVMTWRTTPESARSSGESRPVVLFFHGNGDSLPRLAGHVDYWRADALDVVLATYRGYPGSTGAPSEAALVADGIAVFDSIVEGGRAPGDIIVAGFSLGSAVAVAVAAERRPRALFLQAPPSAIVEVASDHYPFLPVRPLMKDPFRTVDRIGRAEAPVFIAHGSADPVVPLRFGRVLFDAAPEPKEFLVLDGAGHVLGVEDGWGDFTAFLARHARPDRQARVTASPDG